jgi:hypothetical protein
MQVTLSSKTLCAALSAVRFAMAGDDRPHVRGIRLAARPRDTPLAALDVVATNGRWLARYRERGVDCNGGGVDAVTIAAGAVKPLVAWLRACAGAVTIDMDAATISGLPFSGVPFATITNATLAAAEARAKQKHRTAVTDPNAPAHFPAYDEIFARAGGGDTTTPVHAWDSEYLAGVCDAFRALRPPRDRASTNLRFALSEDGLGPAIVTCARHPELTVALMPVRL